MQWSQASANIDATVQVTGNSWFHQDGVGYVILPAEGIKVLLKGGSGVIDSNPGDTDPARVFHLAIDHGTNPDGSGTSGQYAYLLVPNVGASAMPGVLNEIENNLETINTTSTQAHLYSNGGQTLSQLAFYSAATVRFGSGLSVTVNKPALVQLQKRQDGWNIAVQDPTHHADEAAIAASTDFQHILLPGPNQINVGLNLSLQPGSYTYNTQGPDEGFVGGQTVDVVNNGRGASTLTFHLSDRLDASNYRYREELYAGMPAVVEVPFQ